MNYFSELEKLNRERVEIKKGIFFNQETVSYSKNRFTNFYWIDIAKGMYRFRIESNKQSKPLKDFDISNQNVLAGINFGGFLIADREYNQRCSYTNLVVSNGNVLQFPSNSRVCMYSNGKSIGKKYINANGELDISGRKFTWSGLNTKEDTDIKVVGMFDIDFEKVNSKNGRKEIVIKDNTNLVYADSTESILGIKIDMNIHKVATISHRKLDILKYDYAIKGNREDLEGIHVGDIVGSITFGSVTFNTDTYASSGLLELGQDVYQLKENLYRDLVIQKNGMPKPMESEYVKSWSAVLECKDKYIFCINDARPNIENERGINVFELQDYLINKFKYIWCVVGDSGQSSKLMLVKNGRKNIFGNMHYINYNSESAYWDGENGRPISTAILAYE